MWFFLAQKLLEGFFYSLQYLCLFTELAFSLTVVYKLVIYSNYPHPCLLIFLFLLLLLSTDPFPHVFLFCFVT